MADASDSKSDGAWLCAGSSPASGTNLTGEESGKRSVGERVMERDKASTRALSGVLRSWGKKGDGETGVTVPGMNEEKARHGRKATVQEPLFPEMRKDCCYICGRWITQGSVYVGHGLARHKRCKPESPKKVS